MQQQAKKFLPLSKVMDTIFNGDVNTLPDLFEKEGEDLYSEEIVIQVHVKGGTTIEMKTGVYTMKEAEKSVNFALNYCREHYGRVLAWNWKGENVVRTPVTHKSKLDLVKNRVKYYFGLED